MKKILFLISIIGTLLVTSCNHDVDDKFDEDATTRVNRAASEWNSILTSASNGWIVQYFPEVDQRYGGYTFLMKFEANAGDWNVTVASQIADATASETTLYGVTKEDGPVLNMETYNNLFHVFRDPEGLTSVGGTNKHGYEGDIMFILPQITDVIRNGGEFEMRGVQTKNKIRMMRLAPEVSWSTYIGEIQAVKNSIEDANISDYYTEIDGRRFRFQEEGQYFRFKYGEYIEPVPDPNKPDEEPEDPFIKVTDYIAYAFTTQGIRLYEPMKFGSKIFQEFIWDAGSRTMTAIDDPSLVFTAVSPETGLKVDDFLGSWRWSLINRITRTPVTWNMTMSLAETNDHPISLGWNNRVVATPGIEDPALLNIVPRIEYTFNKQTGALELGGAALVSNRYHTYNGEVGTLLYYPYLVAGEYINLSGRPTRGTVQNNQVVFEAVDSDWELEGYLILFSPNNRDADLTLIYQVESTWVR